MTNDDLSPAERQALDALRASRGACPAAETLVAYEALSDQDRARRPEHAHVQVCSRCQLVLLHLREPSAAASSTVLRWALPLAAAAVLVVGLTLVDRRGGSSGPPANDGSPTATDTVRGTEIQPIAPAGSIDAIREFTWQSPIRAERYRVIVRRGDAVVWQTDTTASRVDAPAAIFESRVEYRWQVEGLDREGGVRIVSRPQPFTLSEIAKP